MLRRSFALTCFIAALMPLTAVAGDKAKPTKASVVALKGKLEKARDAIRALAKEAAPKGLTADQKKTFDAEIAKLAPLADGTDTVVKDLDSKLKDSKANLDSLSAMSEAQQMKLQTVMQEVAKQLAACSNLLKKMSDTAQSIVQNIK
jgi:hypothetical protein